MLLSTRTDASEVRGTVVVAAAICSESDPLVSSECRRSRQPSELIQSPRASHRHETRWFLLPIACMVLVYSNFPVHKVSPLDLVVFVNFAPTARVRLFRTPSHPVSARLAFKPHVYPFLQIVFRGEHAI